MASNLASRNVWYQGRVGGRNKRLCHEIFSSGRLATGKNMRNGSPSARIWRTQRWRLIAEEYSSSPSIMMSPGWFFFLLSFIHFFMSMCGLEHCQSMMFNASLNLKIERCWWTIIGRVSGSEFKITHISAWRQLAAIYAMCQDDKELCDERRKNSNQQVVQKLLRWSVVFQVPRCQGREWIDDLV